MSSERIYTWRLVEDTVNPKIFSSYDLMSWGLEFIIIKFKVYQVTFDNESREVLNQRVENSFWYMAPYGRLLQSDHDDDEDDASLFFSKTLSANQIPQDQKMIDEMLSFSRTICTKNGARKNLLFGLIPTMDVHFFFYSPSPSPSPSSSRLNRALAESMLRVTRVNLVAASKSSVEALEKMVIVDDCSMDWCVICLEKFNVGLETVTRMPCCHVYHGDCIVRWLQIGHICPVCRFEMPT